MGGLMPEGEELRRAVKWISAHLQEEPGQPVGKLIQEATFTFNLSPKDAEFLLRFYSQPPEE